MTAIMTAAGKPAATRVAMTTIKGRDSRVLLSNFVKKKTHKKNKAQPNHFNIRINVKDGTSLQSHLVEKRVLVTRELTVCTKLIINTLDNERIRGHSQLQGKHEAFKEVFRQLWDLLRKDLTDEGDELVVLVTQRGELEKNTREQDGC